MAINDIATLATKKISQFCRLTFIEKIEWSISIIQYLERKVLLDFLEITATSEVITKNKDGVLIGFHAGAGAQPVLLWLFWKYT